VIRAKFHKIGGERLLAACDCEVFGKVLEDAEVVLNLGGSFYDGPEVNEDEFRAMLAQATSANLVGKTVVSIAVEQSEVEQANVREIAGIPHALLFYI